MPKLSIPGYEILETIASGGSATVFKALHIDLGRHVAIKVLAPGLFGAAELRERFLREARIQSKLLHPNLLALFDAGFSGRSPYLVCELIAGGSLRALLPDGKPLPLPQAVAIGQKIALGLAAAHEAGVIHRDLKPENVLLTADHEVKLADFGLAREHETDAHLTRSGIILGTPGYLAPEVIGGAEAGPPSDLYALGAMLHEMATGIRVFGIGTNAEVMERQLRAGTAANVSSSGALPGDLQALLIACLHRDPRRRPDAARVAQTLSEMASLPPTTRTQLLPVTGGRDVPRLAPDKTVLTRRKLPPRPPAALPAGGPLGGALRRFGPPMLAAVFTLAVFGLAWRMQPGVREISVPRAPVAPAAPMPSVHRPDTLTPRSEPMEVAAGALEACFRFSPPLPAGTTLTVAAKGEREPLRRTLSAPSSLERVGGLMPGTAYEGIARTPEGERRVRFQTLLPGLGPGSVVLSRAKQRDSPGLAIASRDAWVGVLWCVEGSNGWTLLLKETLDAGVTWSGDQVLAGPAKKFECLALTLVADEPIRNTPALAVACLASDALGVSGLLRWRAGGSRQWSPPLRFATDEPGPLIAPAGPGQLEVVTVRRPGGDKVELYWTRLEGLFTAPPPNHALNFQAGRFAARVERRQLPWARLARTSGRSVLFLQTREPERVEDLLVTGSSTPERGPWPAPTSLVRTKSKIQPQDPALSGESLALACTDESNLQLLVSRDGGATFRRIAAPIEPENNTACPATAILGPEVYTGGIYWALAGLSTTTFKLMRLSGAGKLDEIRRIPIPPTLHRNTLLAATPERFVLVQLTLMEGVVAVSVPVKGSPRE